MSDERDICDRCANMKIEELTSVEANGKTEHWCAGCIETHKPETPKEGSKGETPRTDAPCHIIIHQVAGCLATIEVVHADFARQLERESQQLQFRAERAEKELAELKEARE